MSIMFRKPIPGYKTTIIGDRQGNPHKVQVPITIKKAKAFKVTCSAPGFPAVDFTMDKENATSRGKAIQVASDRYRFVMVPVPDTTPEEHFAAARLRATMHINVEISEIKAKVGTSAHAR